MKKIVLASGNEGKIREIRELLEGLELSVLTLSDFPDLTMPLEDALTFKENALIKARHVAKVSGLMVIADDSGLEVIGLSGAPGVHSARYAGESATDAENIEKLIKAVAPLSENDRYSRFVCAMALVEPALPGGGEAAREVVFDGTLYGIVISELKGCGGFGYDPVFFLPDLKLTAAELTKSEKNKISHRGKALKKLRAYLEGLL